VLETETGCAARSLRDPGGRGSWIVAGGLALAASVSLDPPHRFAGPGGGELQRRIRCAGPLDRVAPDRASLRDSLCTQSSGSARPAQD